MRTLDIEIANASKNDIDMDADISLFRKIPDGLPIKVIEAENRYNVKIELPKISLSITSRGEYAAIFRPEDTQIEDSYLRPNMQLVVKGKSDDVMKFILDYLR